MSKRHPPTPKGPNLVPVFAAVTVIVIAALAVAVMQNMDKEANDADPSASEAGTRTTVNNPFADIANDPTSRSSSGKTLVDTAPPGLMDNAVFRAAKALADDAKVLVKEAEAARKAGDEETFQTVGRRAKEQLELAFEKTGDWVLDLQDRYPNDRQVERIDREMMTWDRALRKVRKVH